MTNFRLKNVGRYDPGWPKYRLARVMWERGRPGFGGYSVKLAFALRPKLFEYISAYAGAAHRLCVLGCEVSYQRNYGGTYG